MKPTMYLVVLAASVLLGVVTGLALWARVLARNGLRQQGVRLLRSGRRLGVAVAVLAVVAVALAFCHSTKAGMMSLGLLASLGCVMSLSIYTDLPTYSFPSNVADALVGKEGYPVELVAGSLKIQLLNAGIYIGDLFERLEGSQAWAVNLRGPIKKAIAGGALNSPAYVKMTANGLVAANSGDKSHGVVVYPFVCAQGDQVSYVKFDCVMP